MTPQGWFAKVNLSKRSYEPITMIISLFNSERYDMLSSRLLVLLTCVVANVRDRTSSLSRFTTIVPHSRFPFLRLAL